MISLTRKMTLIFIEMEIIFLKGKILHNWMNNWHSLIVPCGISHIHVTLVELLSLP